MPFPSPALRVGRFAATLLIVLGLACGEAVSATDIDVPGYVTTSWGAREGSPQDVNAMARTSDGWLWLGTPGGLFRFDGHTFYPYDLTPPSYRGSLQVTDLAVDPTGGLWVTYGRATVAHLAADGRTVTLPTGLPGGMEGVDGVYVDGDGRALAATGDGLFVLRGNAWVRCEAPEWSLPEAPLDNATLDAQGNLVVLAGTRIYRLARHATHFVQIAEHPDFEDAVLISPRDGKLWAAHPHAVALVPGVTMPMRPGPANDSSVRASDRIGHLWTVSQGCPGLCRTVSAPATLSDEKTPVSPPGGDGRQAMSVLGDAAGDVWMGGKQGLVRFHPDDVQLVDGGHVYFAVSPASDGTVLVASDSHSVPDRVVVVTGTAVQTLADALPTTAITRVSDGSAILGGHEGLWRVAGGHLDAYSARPAALGESPIQVLLPAGDGKLWMSMRDHGLFLVSGADWRELGSKDGFPAAWPLVGAAGDDGQDWFGFADGSVAAVEHGATRAPVIYRADIGPVTAVTPGQPLLIGGELGVAWFDGKVFRTLPLRQAGLLRGVTGIVRTPDNAVWINARAGLVRIDATEMARLVSGASSEAAFRLLDTANGLPGGAQQVRPLPTLSVDRQGRLWVAATAGLALVDPSHTAPAPAPRPAITSMASGDGVSLLARGGPLEPADRSLAVGLTGLSAAGPGNVQLRYRLHGVDRAWRFAQGATLLKYADLPSGDFQLEVQARGTEGDWSPSVSSGVVHARPLFRETPLFAVLVALAIAVLIAIAYAFRIASVRRRHAEQTEAKLQERDRIARELHDSTLQGMMGVMLRVTAWQRDERAPADMRAGLEKVSSQLMGLVLDGRARVIALRSVASTRIALSEALRMIGEDHADGSDAAFDLSVEGPELPLGDARQMTILDILREAMHNAFLHADAGHVHVALVYSDVELRAVVRDDGRGIPEEIAEQGQRPGHWGLVTMKERAADIGGRVSIDSEPGRTAVTLTVALA
ncbi:hypothetical protein FIV34_09530 [Luteibacter pinisoli]|uniref:Histidine kinase domain-containing protein n=1 Tax=Luteibacter pinisoli TaxID=2589080 RepID=A0A4Y5Z307_9GAMM|nr:sensor histidine kinase [Luteibacter pinisoli]QDE39424.1 hypothetical protein FIV34_09530 [Luteibacter pinisoli]